jgi:DNA-binding MarR family transcriptional regulator
MATRRDSASSTGAAGVLLREIARTLLQLQRAQVACCARTTSTQCFILGEVGRNGELTPIELGRRLSLDRGWISRAVDSLVDEGLLHKQPHQSDGRSVVLSLTREGERRYAELNRILNQHAEGVLRRIPRADRPVVDHALRQLHGALQAEAAADGAGCGGCEIDSPRPPARLPRQR